MIVIYNLIALWIIIMIMIMIAVSGILKKKKNKHDNDHLVSGIVKTWRTPDWLLQGWGRTVSSFLVVRFLIGNVIINIPTFIIIRGISKSILHFILHSTILYSTLYSTQQFGQDVDVIDNFDINWSSKWLWPIIFSVRVIIQYMHVTCNIWHMTERLPSHNFDWFALLEIGFVPADIWISWFGPFAFVKPSLSHLRVLELECWISPETSFVFSMSNHPHLFCKHLKMSTIILFGLSLTLKVSIFTRL